MSVESQITNQALQAGAQPLVLQLASKLLGAREYIGYCQAFVERMSGNQQRFPSAIQAWNNALNKVQGTQGIQPGDLVYFSPNQSNRGYGHTGIYSGDNQMISATYGGVKKNNLEDWLKSTGQKLLGYLPQGARQVQTQQPQNPQQQPQRRMAMARYNPIPLPTYSTQSPTMPSIADTLRDSQIGRISIPSILG